MRRGFGPWRLLLPLLLAASATVALLHLRQFQADQATMDEALRASIIAAARVATASAEASRATERGFAALEAAGLLEPGLQERLAAIPAQRAFSAAMPDTRELRAAWRAVGEHIAALREVAPKVMSLGRDAERLQSVATGLLVTSDELMDALISAEARPVQLRVAARQLMLIQRISANLRRLMDADAGLLAAADRLGRDAVAFGEVTTGLFNGSEDLGITRVKDSEAREILATVGREFRVLATSVEEVMAGAAARVALTRRHEAMSEALVRLNLANEGLRSALASRAQQHPVKPLQVAQLMGLACLSVLAALILGLSDARAAKRRSRREQQRFEAQREELIQVQQRLTREIEQLGADIHRIADGDSGLRAHTDSGDVPGVGVARAGLDRLRQQLSRRDEDTMQLAHRGRLVGEVASRLRDTASRQAHQAEEAGQATRVMAAALESLRFESAQVSEAARASGASAHTAGAALNETLHELDAVRAGVEDCAERVRALEDVARELRAVRTLVEDVGELGKMLSLNVAIQASVDSAASRALGAFSEEVQRLSNRARSAVVQVEAIHQEMRGEAERAAGAVKESVWRARSAAERARGARTSLDDLSGASRRLEDLNHALGRAQREHAVNVTEVVRAMTAMHALTREVREQVAATTDSASAFSEVAAGLERQLAAPGEVRNPVIEMARETHDDPADGDHDGARAEHGSAESRALGRWSS